MPPETAPVNSESETIDDMKLKTSADLDVNQPLPGIYTKIPFATYCDIDALNSSKIRKACQSMLVYRRYMLQQQKSDKSTDALAFGKAFAMYCDDPGALEKSILVGPTATRKAKAWQDEQKENPHIAYVTQPESVMLKSMYESLNSHPYTKRFMYDAHRELTVIWTCRMTNQKCKALIDIFKDRHCIDIKTIADIRPHKIKYQIMDFRYDIQLTFYMDGLKANGVFCDWASNFFVEKKELLPDVVPKGYNEEQIDECRQQYVQAIHNIIEAEKTGIYDGYAREPLVDLYGFDEPEKTFE